MLTSNVASGHGSTDTDLDEAMEDIDDVDEEGEMDEGPEVDVDLGMNNEREDGNGPNDDTTGDSQDPFIDSPSQPQSQSRPSTRAVSSVFPPTQHGAIASRQASRSFDDLVPPGPTSHPVAEPSYHPFMPHAQSTVSSMDTAIRPALRPEAITAQVYDIVPTIAAPHSTSINAITATPDLRWVFTGGADGYIRKFGWVDTANGKVMLTVAQRHPFVDSVTKAGVLLSYWENEEPPRTYLPRESPDLGPHH